MSETRIVWERRRKKRLKRWRVIRRIRRRKGNKYDENTEQMTK
jgi:hypothetical protein